MKKRDLSTPGPGAYNPKQETIANDKSKGPNLKGRPATSKPNGVPGPGEY